MIESLEMDVAYSSTQFVMTSGDVSFHIANEIKIGTRLPNLREALNPNVKQFNSRNIHHFAFNEITR